MGEVYLAHDTRLHRPVAIKMVHPDLLARPEVRARFVREARIAASIVNPFVATVFDVLDCMAEAPPEGRELVAA